MRMRLETYHSMMQPGLHLTPACRGIVLRGRPGSAETVRQTVLERLAATDLDPVVHAEAGLTTGDFEEAAVKRALHQRAAETVVLASLDKLGTASPFSVAPLRELAALVVPAATPQALRKKLQAGGAKVEIAAG